MGNLELDKIIITPLNKIIVSGGDVFHALKKSDPSFFEFGEAYFSFVDFGAVKAWKMHKLMTLNLVVPIGEIHFSFVSSDFKERRDLIIGSENYVRLTIPPGIWFGFKGLSKGVNLLLNIADILHDPDEVLRIDINEFPQNFINI
jgi:dTDP-4-dehydrorhamnose 3,5-epimerase